MALSFWGMTGVWAVGLSWTHIMREVMQSSATLRHNSSCDYKEPSQVIICHKNLYKATSQMSNHFNANLHQYNNVHATLSHAMFWEALSQPTEWVIAISCKSYCLRKERCIFYSHPTPRMAGFWKGGFGFSSKKVRKKKKPSDFIFQRALTQIWGLGEEGFR